MTSQLATMSDTEQRATLSPLESEVMEFVWRHGRVTADAVHHEFAARMNNASVRTILRRIEAKGLLSHTKEGRAFVYEPKVDAGVVARSALQRVIDRFYDGSVEQLLVGLLDGRMTDQKTLRALSDRVARAADATRKGRKG
jgi:predicted transcriptional regulator